MENNNLYEVENLNGELVIPDLLDIDGNPVVVTEESEESNKANLVGAGIALVGVGAALYMARKPLKKIFRATREAVKTFKDEYSKIEGLDYDCDEDITEESEQ